MIFGRKKKEKKAAKEETLADMMKAQKKRIDEDLRQLEEARKSGEISDEVYSERRRKLESIKKQMEDMGS